jgi:hypothetical protein
MRIFGGLVLLVVMLGWSTWFVICNVYEFAPALDPPALLSGWLLALFGWVFAWRGGRQARRGWALCAQAACNGLYLLLIHRGVAEGIALLVLVIAGVGTLGLVLRTRPVAAKA